MSLRVSARALTPALRRVAYRQARTIAPKQFSSSAHSAPRSNGDKPWIIGSALVFIPTIVYLFSPSARSKPHQGHDQPRATAENTPAEPTKNEETIADAEGTEVPVEEVKASIVQAVTQDAPKEAAQAEAEAAESAKYGDGTPGQDSGAETDHEQIEKPHAEPKKGTLQDEADAEPRPTDLGKAREETKQAGAPKKAAGGKE